jgi:5-methylcytosine-specific restriction endonuclease McrA
MRKNRSAGATDPTGIGDAEGYEFDPIEPNAIGLAFEDLVRSPFRCVNCSSPVEPAKLYCTKVCSAEADFVRYARRHRPQNGQVDPLVVRAIRIRLIHNVEGGYDRRIPEPVRALVNARDRNQCKQCGEPGTVIDHILGDSNDPSNLQLLCTSCHDDKTVANFIPITEGWKLSHPEKWRRRQWLRWRANQPTPVQLCDDSERWDEIHKEMMTARNPPRQSTLW